MPVPTYTNNAGQTNMIHRKEWQVNIFAYRFHSLGPCPAFLGVLRREVLRLEPMPWRDVTYPTYCIGLPSALPTCQSCRSNERLVKARLSFTFPAQANLVSSEDQGAFTAVTYLIIWDCIVSRAQRVISAAVLVNMIA